MRENKGRWSVTFTGVALLTTLGLGAVTTTTQATSQAGAPERTQATNNQATSNQATSTPVAATQVAPPAARLAAGARTTARWAGAVNTGDQAAVNAAYWAKYAPKLNLSVDWLLGSLLGCNAGVTASSTNAATLSALNFVRSLSGLAPVVFSKSLNDSAQRAALIMAANGTLSHYPSSSWRCWSSTGARAASRSNLALAYPSLGAGQIIDLYMDDPGSDNVAAGHRRWILNPFSTVMGSGSTSTANALTVVGPSSGNRPNPAWVTWPAKGWFPNAIEPRGRWSISSGLRSVSFSHAWVRVYQNGARIGVHRYPVHNGYAQPTLVWQMPSGIDQTGTFRVVVGGIHKAGAKRALKTAYTVRLFTPSQ